MLNLAVFDQHLRLRYQLRIAARSHFKTGHLHLSATGLPSDPSRVIQETAHLMQLRLHLEAQTDSLAPWRSSLAQAIPGNTSARQA